MKTVIILIAEDDLEDRLIITGAFGELEHGPQLHFVNNGIEVLDYLMSGGENILPSLIILDLNMPRMNGTETLREVKKQEKFSNIPVMIFSTSVNEIEKNACLKLGAADYVTKPSTYSEGIAIAQYFFDFAMR